jgi:prevent-host-death family protein
MSQKGDTSVKTIAAHQAKNAFGRFIDTAHRERVAVERHGRRVFVAVPAEDYEHLEALEDAYWGERAEAARAEGLASPEETDEVIRSILDAQD